MTFRLLNLVRPFLAVLPDVAPPDKRLPFARRAMFTVVALLIYLICSRLPLYGIRTSQGSDPMYWIRVIFASSRGTTMELGISPVVTSGLVIQLLVGSKLIDIDTSVKSDMDLMQGAEKLLGVLITVGQALAYVVAGMYGDLSDLGAGNAILIVLQLFFAGIIVICLDELLKKGHGMGSAISLFIATNAFSPYTIQSARGMEFEGAIIALFHFMLTRNDKMKALKDAFYRQNMPNISSLMATVLVFMVVVYFQARFSSGPAHPQQAQPRPEHQLPHQALLHQQHAHHSAECAGEQPVLHQPAALQALPLLLLGPAARPLVRHGGRWIHGAQRWPGVLPLTTPQPGAGRHEPPARALLHRLHARRLRAVQQDVDRGQWQQRQRRREAVEGCQLLHPGPPRERDQLAQGAQPIHPNRCSVWWHVHWRADDRGGLVRRHWQRHRHPSGRHNCVPVLRDVGEREEPGRAGLLDDHHLWRCGGRRPAGRQWRPHVWQPGTCAASALWTCARFARHCSMPQRQERELWPQPSFHSSVGCRCT